MGDAARHEVAVVAYADETYPFAEGDCRTFGRNDAVVDIPVWEAIHGDALSRLAGELWCRQGQIWVRNLSLAHEIHVLVPGRPPLDPLPRRESDADPGAAVTVPAPEAWICGPGGLRLHVQQDVGAAGRVAPGPTEERPTATRYTPAVPEDLKAVAVALCEPLLRGGPTAATYTHIGTRLGLTRKATILRVERLVDLYRQDLPELGGPGRAVVSRSVADEPQWVGGRWVLPGASEALRAGVEQPFYADVAALLVRRRLVRPEDLTLLGPGGRTEQDEPTGQGRGQRRGRGEA